MSKPETRYYTAVNRLVPKQVHREKMHNIYRGGTADFWYSGNLDDLWVEFKYVTAVPKRAAVWVHKELSALQLEWLSKRHAEGRNVVVILGTPYNGWVYEFKTWESHPVTLEQLTRDGLTKSQVADFIRRKTMLP